ncbi:MAG: Trm112 family protein [Pseudomonadota bacterium]
MAESSPPALDPKVLDLLVCPVSRGPLRLDSDAQELISDQAGLAFPIRDGIPIMLESEARALDTDH